MPRIRKLPATEATPEWAIGLTDREVRFVSEYVVDLNGKAAGIRAGLGRSEKSATEIASRLRKKAAVAAAISQLIAERSGTTSAAVLNEVARIAFAQLPDFMQIKDGVVTVTDTADLTEDQRAAIAEISETVNESGRTIRIKLHDKGGALDKLAKVLGLYRDRVEVSGPNGGPIEMVDPLEAITRRLAQLRAPLVADAPMTVLPPRTRQIAPFAPVKVIDAD